MKKIGFIGVYDKTDLMIYIAKILTMLGKKILIVDNTMIQKARYVVPAINPTKMYITEYEEMDIAVGFSNLEEIKQYLGLSIEQEMEYDMVFIDTDSEEGIEKFELQTAQRNYFVTSFDIYSLKKGLEAVKNLKEPLSLTKILYTKEMLKEDNEYLNFLSLGYKIIWTENIVNFPIENGDLSVIYENQKVAKVQFKRLSALYKEQLAYLAEEISGNISGSKIRKVIKNNEKGG